jgi:predicted nucleic acid-binding protein
MSIVYAESSAILAWLLGEPGQGDIVDALAAADEIVTSALTIVECARGLLRARLARRISAAEEAAAFRVLDAATRSWNIIDLSEGVIAGARQRFPREPVRTLDALHLASALLLRDAVGAVHMLSLDDRVRSNATELGLVVAP